MKFSESWLREWVNPDFSTEELVEKLTMAGLEVDAVEAVAGDFNQVVVGEIIEIAQHPDADKLRVCQVEGSGDGIKQVVCGAPNARVGLKVPFALVGAVLPNDLKIKKAKLRGVESLGMLCGQTELLAGDDDSGLWELASDAPVGTSLREYLNLDDKVIEVDLTPNRSDCLGIKGLAREVGVLGSKDVTEPTISASKVNVETALEVNLEANDACPKYIGRVIKNVNLKAPSPTWLTEKLRRSDIRSIDPIVDVTNYVLLELGQPMHAFDLAKLSGAITVRMAKDDEELELLNDQKLTLKSDSLVIADDKGALALAGIMGGSASAVSESTTDIFLESAFFNPIAIAGRARSYGLHTDSSHRFERGVDPFVCEQAIERATQLITEIAGGEAGPLTRAEAKSNLLSERSVTLSKALIEKRLGFAIPESQSLEILQRLGLELLKDAGEAWTFKVPSYRFDISIAEDLLEELARIYGYNNLPTTSMLASVDLKPRKESSRTWRDIAGLLLARDYQEVITYSFIDPQISTLFSGASDAIEVMNPISADMGVMRTSLLPGLVQTLQYNSKRQQQRIRIFERGLSFKKGAGEEYEQLDKLAGLIYGTRTEEAWTGERSWVDFYDLKGDVCAMLESTGKEIGFEAVSDIAFLHPGQSAQITLDGVVVGHIGALHPSTLKSLSLKKSTYVFEIELCKIIERKVPEFESVSRFPAVNRDLAFVVAHDLEVNALEKSAKNQAGELLKQLKVFDIYSGEGIDSERKSVAFNLTFQHSSRTLNEEEVNAMIDAIITRLEVDFDARLR